MPALVEAPPCVADCLCVRPARASRAVPRRLRRHGGGSSDVERRPRPRWRPPDAPLYIEATVRPDGRARRTRSTRRSARSLGTDDPGGKIVSLLDEPVASNGQPTHLPAGRRAVAGRAGGGLLHSSAAASETPKGAAVVETTDAGRRARVRSHDCSAATGDRTRRRRPTRASSYSDRAGEPTTASGSSATSWSIGDETASRPRSTPPKGESLGDSSDFKDRIDALPDDRLGDHLLDPEDPARRAIGLGQLDRPSRQLLESRCSATRSTQPVAGALDGLRRRQPRLSSSIGRRNGVDDAQSPRCSPSCPASPGSRSRSRDLGESLRADARSAQGLDGLPDVEQRSAAAAGRDRASTYPMTSLSWLGDAAPTSQGTTRADLSGALVVQTNDPRGAAGGCSSQLQSAASERRAGAATPLPLRGRRARVLDQRPGRRSAPSRSRAGRQLVIGSAPTRAAQALEPDADPRRLRRPSSARPTRLGDDFGTEPLPRPPLVLPVAESGGAKADPDYRRPSPTSTRSATWSPAASVDEAELSASSRLTVVAGVRVAVALRPCDAPGSAST